MNEEDLGDKTLDNLELEAERNRAELAGTMDALKDRFGGGGSLAGSLSDQARGYVDSRRTAAVEGMWKRVEDHPLQTVALAAGIAYPIVRIATKIPAPILMLGAGVALAGRGSAGPSKSEQTTTHAVAVSPPISSSGATLPIDGEFREPQTSDASKATSFGSMGSDGFESDGGTTSSIGNRAVEAGRIGSETIVESIRRNPMLAGGVSLMLGAALAAMLPRTRVEGQAFGDAAQDIRNRARSLAGEGIDAGREAIGAAAGAAAGEARAQNITEEDMKDVIREGADRLGETIRDVADDAQDAIEGSSNAGSNDTSDGKSD